MAPARLDAAPLSANHGRLLPGIGDRQINFNEPSSSFSEFIVLNFTDPASASPKPYNNFYLPPAVRLPRRHGRVQTSGSSWHLDLRL